MEHGSSTNTNLDSLERIKVEFYQIVHFLFSQCCTGIVHTVLKLTIGEIHQGGKTMLNNEHG